jgi:TRAP-type C4-dicarboxylate transport system substrate-binding protein
MLTLLRSGAVDMAYIAPGYIPEKFPLSGVAELPRMVASSCAGTKSYWPMLNGGLLDKREFAPNGIVPIMGFMSAPSQLQARGVPHVPATDLQGLKVRGTGSAMELTIRSLGGVPIQIPGPDIRQALERGTIDAVIGLSPSAITYDHVQFLSYVTTNANLSAPGLTYSIGVARWRSLPADVKELIRSVSEEAVTHFCAADDRLEAEALKEMQKRGITAVTLSDTEQKQLDKQIAAVRLRWVESMNERGLPGQEALDAFTATAH